jgi:hypothetical protein
MWSDDKCVRDDEYVLEDEHVPVPVRINVHLKVSKLGPMWSDWR